MPSFDIGGRAWVLPQLGVPWFLHDHGSPAAFRMETGGVDVEGVDKKGELGGEEGRETVAGR